MGLVNSTRDPLPDLKCAPPQKKKKKKAKRRCAWPKHNPNVPLIQEKVNIFIATNLIIIIL